jgi:hypothetical protein
MEVIRPTIASLEARGLIGSDGGLMKPTELGFRFLNDVQAAFLPPSAPTPRQLAR